MEMTETLSNYLQLKDRLQKFFGGFYTNFFDSQKAYNSILREIRSTCDRTEVFNYEKEFDVDAARAIVHNLFDSELQEVI